MIYIIKTGYLLTWSSPDKGPRTYACTDGQALDALILRLTGRNADSFPVEGLGDRKDIPIIRNVRIANQIHIYSDGDVAWEPVETL